jgi:hypothetical protein
LDCGSVHDLPLHHDVRVCRWVVNTEACDRVGL